MGNVRILHGMVGNHYQGTIISDEFLPDVDKLVELGAVERIPDEPVSKKVVEAEPEIIEEPETTEPEEVKEPEVKAPEPAKITPEEDKPVQSKPVQNNPLHKPFGNYNR